MSGRDSILRAIGENRPGEVEAPKIPRFRGVSHGSRPKDLVARFTSAVQGVGGSYERCPDDEAKALLEVVRRHYPTARNIVCAPDCPPLSTMEIAIEDSPADLVEVELAIVRGRLGVAENGAIWVEGESLPHPALPFVAEHLVLLLDRAALVSDMHDAYRVLSGRDSADPQPGEWPDYGVFISGPSKTADIEQSLVMGAQGPRSALVVLQG
jgi:L-lactate dehydrogenase complex protein LldG